MARRQVEAGANWLLLDLGPQRKSAGEDLAWLVTTVQDEVMVPLALRGDDPVAVEAGIHAAHGKVLIDATLPGVEAPDPFIELARRHGTLLALSACADGLPTPTEERLAYVSETLLPKAFAAGLSLEQVYIDPLVTALTCDQPMVPATVETLRLLKVAAEPSPNTLVHLDDLADGVADAARPYVTQAYLTMVLAAGVDALVANASDPDVLDVLRIVQERDPVTDYDRLLLRLFDVTKAEATLDLGFVNQADPEQVKLYKTVRVLTNELLYAGGYLQA